MAEQTILIVKDDPDIRDGVRILLAAARCNQILYPGKVLFADKRLMRVLHPEPFLFRLADLFLVLIRDIGLLIVDAVADISFIL